MKKFLGFLKNKVDEYEYEEDWDDVEDMEYSDEEYDEEVYESEEYAEETYESEEYVAETYESEEYNGEVYEAEEYEGEYSEPAEYTEEFYEGEPYGEYYADEDPYYVEEYEDGEEYSEEDLEMMEEEDWQEPMPVNFFEKIRYAFVNMDMTDRVIACAGVAILILALVTGSVFAGTHLTNKQVNSFATVGNQLEGISVIGGDGLLAVADAQMARQEAANMIEEELEEESQGYEEAEYSKEVVVALNMTSIKKDLKIKFVNKKTGKLIPNVPFEVTVTDPDGKTSTWKDEDKDGIIYKTEIKSGKYSVTMNALTGYEDYKISTEAQSTKVKENLDYEKVDVSDEIKKESEIDAAKEDTAKNDVVEESSLQDTVTWVESTRTPINETYTEVPKNSIDEPKVARFGDFVKLTGTDVETVTVSIEGDSQVTANGSLPLTASSTGIPEGVDNITYSWTVDGSGAQLSSDTGSTVTLTANNTETVEKTITVHVTVSATKTTTVTDGNATQNYSASASKTVKIGATQVQPITITLDKTTGTVQVAKTLELIPTLAGNTAAGNTITWTSSNTAIATVTGDNTKATVTGVKAGDATITASYTENGKTVTATCAIKVQNNPALDTTTALKDKNGNQIYVKNAQGQYVAATYADYFKENQKFYLRQQGYKYTGWQTIDGKVYFFDANGNKVTGAQVIQGAQYSFDSNGVMVSSNGILGIDVSKWNGSIDWNAVKNSGVSYVIIRCGYRGSSQGSLVEDPKYRTNIQGATAAGLKVGVYFFTQAVNEIEAVEEASMVLSLVSGYKLSYPIFLDVESSGGRADGISKETRTAVCKAFCQTIKNSGYTAGVYANKTWFTNYIDAGQLGAYRIWLAQYASKPTYTGRYDIWQYSSKGKVGGISGNVDMNLSYMGY